MLGSHISLDTNYETSNFTYCWAGHASYLLRALKSVMMRLRLRGLIWVPLSLLGLLSILRVYRTHFVLKISPHTTKTKRVTNSTKVTEAQTKQAAKDKTGIKTKLTLSRPNFYFPEASVQQLIPYLKELEAKNLTRSFQHQRKFFTVKDQVLLWAKNITEHNYSKRTLVQPCYNQLFYAYNLNRDFSFRHIFKSGGTTVERQLKTKRHNRPVQVGNRTLIASVRDPIDHFLSGWAECGERFPNQLMTNSTYDDRIVSWLSFIQANCTSRGADLCACRVHSLPQANFLLNKSKGFISNLGIVGDLKELPGLLGLAGVAYNTSVAIGRNSSTNQIKQEFFPSDIRLLSNRTLQDICRYVALDYYLFCFEPPEACNEELVFYASRKAI